MLSEADFTGPSIGSHIDILSGFAFSSGGFHETEGLPLIRIRDLGKSGTEVRFCGRYDDQFIVRNGDTLIGMDGDFVAVRWNGGHALLNQRVCKVSAKPGGAVDTGYLFHLLQPQLDEIHRRTPQTTVRHLSANTLKDIRPFLPPLLEQRRIAEILDTLDEAIRKTEQVIAKLQQMKQGLLHDLLTRGIDDNGELRDPDRHPEQFKDSPLGRIPRDWEVAPLGAALESAIDGRFGSGLKTSHYVSSGVRVVRLQNIGAGYFDETDKAFMSERYARSLVRHEVRPGDLLVASLGDENHPIARACRYPDNLEPGIVKADCFRLRPLVDRAHAGFLIMALNCPETRRDVSGLSQGVTRDRVNLGNLKRIRIAFPPLAEQAQAFSLFSEADQRLSRENSSLAKHRTLKHGLMDDLLTGRVRAPVAKDAAR